MKFGIWTLCTEHSLSPFELAAAVEERGFDSFWLPEHTHIPASRISQPPTGGELPTESAHTLDPFVGLTAAAMATKNLELGTGITLVPQRDPIILAKEVASLDQVSGGRFLFGVGGGWNREESENHGMPWDRRFKVMRERIEAMQAIWTQEEASYSGEFVNFEKIWCWPKPLRKPYPPIIVGGFGEHTLKRVVRYGDEWMPSVVPSLGSFAERILELQTLAAEAGREPIPVGLYRAPTDKAELIALRKIGVNRVVFLLPTGEREAVLPELDRLAGVMRSVSTT